MTTITTGQPADERELQHLIKDWRTGRATRSIGQAISDAYVAVLGIVMVGAMAINVLLKAQTVAASCSQEGCHAARTFLPWAVLALSLALALMVARLFGPVLASAAEGFWLLDTPINRARLLGRRLLAAIVIAFLAGGIVGALITLLTGAGPTAIAAWGLATALGCAGLVAWAAAEQGAERTVLTRVVMVVCAVAAVGTLLLVVAIAAGWVSVLVAESNLLIPTAVGGVGLLLLLGAGLVARARLGRIRRTRLVSGGALVKGLSGAFFALDLGLARDIVVERAAVERGHVRPRRGGGTGLGALRWREVQRVLRSPAPLAVVAATVVVPYAADALGMGTLAPVFGGIAVWLALVPLMNGLRVLSRTIGLARCFPFSTPQLRMAALTVPIAMAVVWAIATVPAFVGFGEAVHRDLVQAIPVAFVTAAAGLLGAMRWTTAKQVDFAAPMIATQAGALPPGLMANLFKGIDMVLVVTAPVLLGWSPLWSFALAGIVLIVLLGFFNLDDLRAQEERQKRELAQQRAAKGATGASTGATRGPAKAPGKPAQAAPGGQSKAEKARQQELAKLQQKKRKK